MVESVATSKEPRKPAIEPRELACQIYDLYRTIRMNALYYGAKLRNLQRWSLILEISVALATSATIGSLAVVKPALPYVAVVAAILGVLKPILNISKRIERLSKLWLDYTNLYREANAIVSDMQMYHAVTPEMAERYLGIRERSGEICLRDDPCPDQKSLLKH